jgi:tetratricopeptide (TPR) repeat protein
MALSKGYLAYYQAIRNNYVSAFANGLSSVNYFEKCINKDSSFSDAYVAIGTYKYWKSEKSEFLKWLPFIEDERDKAVRYLIKAEHTHTYNQYLAAYSLVWVFINKKEYNKAIEYSQMTSRRYPSSRFFKWGLARAYESVDCIKSAAIYGEILNSLYSVGVNNHYQEIILKHKMAMMYKRGNNREKALTLCKEILSINQLSQSVKDKLGNRLDRVKKLYYELSNNGK